jgi:hypothetical protein
MFPGVGDKGKSVWQKVRVEKETHFGRYSDFLYTNRHGQRKRSRGDDWKEASYHNKRVWTIRGSNTNYYTHQKMDTM